MSATEYSIFLTASIIVSILVFVMSILAFGIKARGARLFGLLMLAIAIWCFAIGGQMISITAAQSLIWTQFQMLGVVLVPPLWLLFTLDFSGREKKMPWWQYLLLFANAVIMTVLLLVTGWRHLVVQEFIFESVNGYLVLIEWRLGPYFFVHLAWMLVLVLLGDVVILRHALQWPRTARKKLIMVILATFFPLLTNLALVFNFFPNIHGNLDVFGFSAAGIMLGVVLFLDKILEIQPVATRQLVEELPDALLVFNSDHELIQVNPATSVLLGDPISESIKDQFEALINEIERSPVARSMQTRLVLPGDGKEHHYDVQISSLVTMGRLVGYSVLLRDVTDLVRSMEQLENLATTDPLTGLFNRRYFQMEGERLMDLAIRHQHPICVMTFDIDHFKEINDRYGHPVGDEVLLYIADQMRLTTRKTDIAARFGGDEFVFLLPESTPEFAITLSERIQQLFFQQPFQKDGIEIKITASFGIASLLPPGCENPPTLDELVRYADQKLYEAKENGRNQIRY